MDKSTAIWTLVSLLVGVGVTVTGWVSVYFGYSCLLLAAILAAYHTREKLMRLFIGSTVQQQPTDITEDVVQAPLFVRSEMISGVYPTGTVLGGIVWTSDLRDLRVTFANESKYDYKDLDLSIHLHYPSTLIRQIGQISDLPRVSFIYMGPEFHQTIKTQKTNIIIPRKSYGNNYRMLCDKLPHYKGLVISIAVAYKDILNNGEITKILIKGQYVSQSTPHTIDEIVKVSH